MTNIPFVICGFCKNRMPASEAERRQLGGRESLFCPRCKGPCLPEIEVQLGAASIPAVNASVGSSTEPAQRPKLGFRSSASSVVTVPQQPDIPAEKVTAKTIGLVAKVEEEVTHRRQRERSRQLRQNRNPWSAFWFPLKPLSFLAILLMVIIFSAKELIMKVGLIDDEDSVEESPTPTSPRTSKANARKSGQAPADSRVVDNVQPWVERYKNSGPYSAERRALLGQDEEDSVAGPGRLIAAMVGLGATSLIFKAFFAMYFAALLLGIIYETSNGTDHFPRWPNPLDVVDAFFVPAFHFSACVVVSFLPAVAAFLLPFWFPEHLYLLWMSAPVLLVMGLVYFPMSLMAVAMRGEASASMPSIVIPAILKAHVHYVPAILALGLLLGWQAARALDAAPNLPTWQLILIDYAAYFTLLVVCMRALGLLHRRIEDRLNWMQFARI